MLIRHIEDSQQPPERVLLGVRIVERESVARIQP
jgi:DNA-binding LacI/PurR family transcriptional regulator